MSLNDEKLTNLYKNIDKAEPSPMIESRIQREAKKTTSSKRSSHYTRWLSAAAVLVLSVGVVLRVVQETPVKQDFEESSLTEEVLDQSDNLEKTAPIATEITDSKQIQSRQAQAKAKAASKPSQSVLLEKKVAPAAAAPAIMEYEKPIEAESAADFITAEPVYQGALRSGVSGFMSSEEPWCGQADLEGVNEKQPWIDRMSELKSKGELGQVNCIEQLILRQFAD